MTIDNIQYNFCSVLRNLLQLKIPIRIRFRLCIPLLPIGTRMEWNSKMYENHISNRRTNHVTFEQTAVMLMHLNFVPFLMRTTSNIRRGINKIHSWNGISEFYITVFPIIGIYKSPLLLIILWQICLPKTFEQINP